MPRGLIDTTFIDFPQNVDETYLRGLDMRSGLAFTELASRLDAALDQVNDGVDPMIAALMAPPTTSVIGRAIGRVSGMTARKRSEYSPDRPQYVERLGAPMLAIDEIVVQVGFTEDGLNEISLDDFQAQVDAVGEALERASRSDTLFRLFSDAEIPIDTNTTATSPGFAGSGTGTNVFSGYYPDGNAIPGGYTHYYRDTSANRGTVLRSARDRMRLWYPGPFDLIGSEAFVDGLIALADGRFVPVGSVLVRPAADVAEALVDPLMFVGVYDNDIRVWNPIVDFTTDHAVLFKSWGNFNSNNALIWRYDALRGQDAYVRSRELFPLANAEGLWKYGVNVNNRVAASPIYIAASGAYTPPTFVY
jgi:hypothetical protein